MLFVILYQREAHAGEVRGNVMDFGDIEQPETIEERIALAKKSCDELSIATLVVIDDMHNTVRKAYGELPNSAYFVARDGVIAHKEAWARPNGWPDLLRALVAQGM